MDSTDDARRAMREMLDELGRAGDQAVRLMRQAAEDMSRMWAAPRRPDAAGEQVTPFGAIRELGRLRDEGLITEQEFQAKKAELLQKI